MQKLKGHKMAADHLVQVDGACVGGLPSVKKRLLNILTSTVVKYRYEWIVRKSNATYPSNSVAPPEWKKSKTSRAVFLLALFFVSVW